MLAHSHRRARHRRPSHRRTRVLTVVGGVVLASGAGVQTAHAARITTASVDYPQFLTVGQNDVPISLTLTNGNDGNHVAEAQTICNLGGVGDCDGSQGLILVPACGALNDNGFCKATGFDGDVFTVSTTATGRADTECEGMTFDVDVIDPDSGAVRITPQVGNIVLPATGTSCGIDLTVDVDAAPTKDGSLNAGNQTLPSVRYDVDFPDPAGNRVIRDATIATVLSPPTMTTDASDDVEVGGVISDTVTLSGLVDPDPAATVTFNLYGPDDDCSDSIWLDAIDGPDDGVPKSSAGYNTTEPGVYRFVASYSGDANTAAVEGDCGDEGESVTVSAPEPDDTCDGLEATIVGTEAGETIIGTTGRDVIVARGGKDRIYGAGDDDVICAGGGDDRIFAGSGHDRVFGGAGEDRIHGDSGHDELDGEGGADWLDGDSGHDVLRGGAGDDVLRGGSGTDSGKGGGGDDQLTSIEQAL